MLENIVALCRGWPVIVTLQLPTDSVTVVSEDGALVITREEYWDNLHKEKLNKLLPKLCATGPW